MNFTREDVSCCTAVESVPKMNLLKIYNHHHRRQEAEERDDSTSPPATHVAPIVSPYNDRIRPLLDTVDRLRHLKIMQEGIQLPTIVVVGDQSSGKSSVLESLAGIRLPRGQGMCTRVPLIMRLKNHQSPQPELSLEFNKKTVLTDEANVVDEIFHCTQEIAGKGKGISNKPLTLVVKKRGVPDLTMIDLPGITRVPVDGQPEDISEQISEIILEHISPEESIILNVLPAGNDFSTCESIRMSHSVDKSGKRTLAVVTKADKSPEGLLEKVTADDVNIGLGYVCVRNRIEEETYEEARNEEAKLFKTHPLLSRIDKSMVGIPVLAERLTMIQANIIMKCLPGIVQKIKEKLAANLEELNKMPKHLSSTGEATTAFMNVLGSARESLRKILLHGEFDEYPDAPAMHATARLAEMLDEFSKDLRSAKSGDNATARPAEMLDEFSKAKSGDYAPACPAEMFDEFSKDLRSAKSGDYATACAAEMFDEFSKELSSAKSGDNGDFLVDEMKALEESRSVGLPGFVPKSAFRTLLAKRVKEITAKPFDCAERIWSYIETLVISVLRQHCENYPQLISCTRRAAQNLVARKKEESAEWITDLVEMEKLTDYTCSPEYTASWNTLMSEQGEFMRRVQGSFPLAVVSRFGEINVAHLWGVGVEAVQASYDLKMRVEAYWEVMTRRMVDNMVLHLQFGVEKMVNKEMEKEIIEEVMGPKGNGMERMMEELPSVKEKRKKLHGSIDLLKQSKDVVADIMDKIVVEDD